ncbi:MAG: bifunctional RNase H/acid phosphatase [Sporichthyaceae bacterium]|nr:bifunctional RNase H/acid phosphatase [Sporichthyaceae bacterium]
MTRFIVEADGGSRGNPGPAAYGAVVRDAQTGQVLAERAAHIGTATNNVAEYRGLIAGLTAARELDPDATVEARLDSKLVVEQMTGRWKIKHPAMRPLALQARDLLPAERVTYVWVPRARNTHADRLANEALDAAARGEQWSESTSTAELQATVDEAEVEPPPATTPNALVGWDTGLGVPTTTLLLRHGETAHTAAKRFSGSGGADPPLTAEGERQAAAAGERLTRHRSVGGAQDVTAIVSSPLRRARQTADLVAQGLGVAVREVEGFRECAFGRWEGLTFEEVQRGWPAELTAWLANTSVAPPGGESFEDVRRRVHVARDQTVTRFAGRTVLVVTHVTPIKLLVRDALGAPMTALYRMELAPATLTEVQWFGGGQASLRRFNDAAHL